MWQWTANIATASMQMAQAMLGALADTTAPTALKIINMATIAALSGLQLGQIIASKPVAPSFSTGGFLTGTSYRGDKIPFMGNAGEAILNPAEMRNFMALANGNIQGSKMNVVINNSAANIVDAKPEITEDGIKLMIRETVSKDMADGRFNQSYGIMQSNYFGTRLVN